MLRPFLGALTILILPVLVLSLKLEDACAGVVGVKQGLVGVVGQFEPGGVSGV